ncbi:phage holin family protein [Paenibacillus sp. UMB4589-SE434]|uniref:phage holin family protein n=1 Tax=Paenibacillus sp. UMB4589-SE434 TaxID=3046314 RepID=UPI00254A2C1D|nr:phage holin family protein [Paenibacillus sp. UMB4589-SE434]MDK8182128.1 phage holin family protein [Paenibacillus sp. UMB4589-SE434]
MEWNIIFELIDPALLIVVAACWVAGYVLKQTPRVQDWTIVYIVTGLAIVMTVWILGFGPQSIIQGILAGAFSVFSHQVIKQTKKGGDSNV